ncbi:MAG: ABC transporter permease [Verrucomicrobiota bacterium JB022]|nr:ABC transporter permease [Verrucomicrobiota bacterium JB022]
MFALLNVLNQLGSGLMLLLRTLRYLPYSLRMMPRIVDQCLFIGNGTLPLTAILSLFIGGVLALQFGYSANAFGATDFIGGVVGVSLVRELAPVMTAIMLTGRVGSAVTAELASMKVYQEVDALKTMNIPPERFLVLPRLIAVAITMPLLTMTSNLMGWIGGQLVVRFVPWLDQTTQTYYNALRAQITVKDLTDGLVKGEIFALMVIIVCCNVGLQAQGGPREIGAAVTRAVVSCIIFILLLDYFVTYTQL